jgi:hypothetical protein
MPTVRYVIGRSREVNMKGRYAWFFALAVSCGAASDADEASLKKIVKGRVEEINNALIKEDFANHESTGDK